MRDLPLLNFPPDHFWPWVRFSRGGCWLWTRSRNPVSGYGNLRFRGRTYATHRVAWVLSRGAPCARHVLHTCDNRLCVRPSHLFEGDNTLNTLDSVLKGRNAFGERNGQAKVTAAQVAAIRARYAAGGITQRQLAREYGVIQQAISLITRGHNWRRAAPIDLIDRCLAVGYAAKRHDRRELEAKRAAVAKLEGILL